MGLPVQGAPKLQCIDRKVGVRKGPPGISLLGPRLQQSPALACAVHWVTSGYDMDSCSGCASVLQRVALHQDCQLAKRVFGVSGWSHLPEETRLLQHVAHIEMALQPRGDIRQALLVPVVRPQVQPHEIQVAVLRREVLSHAGGPGALLAAPQFPQLTSQLGNVMLG
jgi:hypothetical protein